MTSCHECGSPSLESARYCAMCGVAQMRALKLASDPVRSVTVLFCDIADSTVLANRLNPEAWSAMLAAYFEVATQVAEEAGGRVEKFIGDAVVIVFGVDTGHEDDATAAVRAGLAIRDRVSWAAGEHLRLRGVQFAVRVGIASGRAAIASQRDSSFAIGSTLNRAARLQSSAGLSEIVADTRTWLLTRDDFMAEELGELPGKGFPSGIKAWRVLGPADEPVDHGPFVNHVDLRRRLADFVSAGLDRDRPVLANVTGPVGVGKSRLVQQILHDTERGCAVIRMHCRRDSAVSALLQLYALHEAIAAGAGEQLPATAPVPELIWLITVALARLAAHGSVVLLIEDADWASVPLTACIRRILDSAIQGLVVIMVGRSTGEAMAPHPIFVVPPLAPDAARELISDEIELHGSDQPDRIVEHSGGNPLFLRQLAYLMAERPGDADLLAPSAEAAVGERLDRLSRVARVTLGAVAAFGGATTVADLLAVVEYCRDGPGDFADVLAELDAARLLTVRGAAVHLALPIAATVAYIRLGLRDQARLHGEIARMTADRIGRRLELTETVAHHAITAHRAWTELAPNSDDERKAAGIAYRASLDAIRFALQHGAVTVALQRIDQTRSLCTVPREQVAVAALAALAHVHAGDPTAAKAVIETVREVLGEDADPAGAADLLLTESLIAWLADGAHLPGMLREARRLADQADDPAVLSRALLLESFPRIRAGDYPGAQRLLSRSVRLGEQSRFCMSIAESYGNLSVCLAYGDMPAEAAVRTTGHLLDQIGRAPTLRAAVGCPAALLAEISADSDRADRLIEEATATCESLGLTTGLAGVSVFRAGLAVHRGDLAAAAHQLDRASRLWSDAELPESAAAVRTHWALYRELMGDRVEPATGRVPVGWSERATRSLHVALHAGRRDALRIALEVLDGVRGDGAVLLPLLDALRVAIRLDDRPLAAVCRTRLHTVAERKGDRMILERLNASGWRADPLIVGA